MFSKDQDAGYLLVSALEADPWKEDEGVELDRKMQD